MVEKKNVCAARLDGVPEEEIYSTTWMKEMRWLKDHGVRYKLEYINGATTFKYKKTVMLYASLADFYKTVRDRE